ncbi:MAG: hypothetical protein ACKOE6_07000, partial [Flammeovirgaceae bacterium]
ENLNPTSLSTSIEDSIKKSEPPLMSEEPKPVPPGKETTAPAEAKKDQNKVENPVKKEEPTNLEPSKPKLDVVDPTEELVENTGAEKNNAVSNNRGQVSVLHIAVETDAANKKYSFHYQFAQGKLHLYGDFDKGLYEILEVNGDSRAVFMFYKELFYVLDEKQTAITKLEPIKDKALISKLKEYRGR